jgi:hypothetical protein
MTPMTFASQASNKFPLGGIRQWSLPFALQNERPLPETTSSAGTSGFRLTLS